MPGPALRRILILFAHPAYDKSRIGRHLLEAVRGMAGVTVRDLYALYPDFLIDVKKEQAVLLEHDLIVFQHPFYWYSSPALLKEWQDLVLEHGWSYGKEGRALEGKYLMNAVTTGGPQEAYRAGGNNRFTMREYLRPYDQTAKLCKMKYLAPFTVHKVFLLDAGPALDGHGEHYRRVLSALQRGEVDLDAAAAAERMNDVVA